MTRSDSQDPMPSVTRDQLRSVTGGVSLAEIGGLFGSKGKAAGSILEGVFSLIRSNKGAKPQQGASAASAPSCLPAGNAGASSSDASEASKLADA